MAFETSPTYQTYYAYAKDRRLGSTYRVMVQARDPGEAKQLLEGQYGRENLDGTPSVWHG